MIELESVQKSFGDKLALDDVSLRVNAGTITGLLGPNGSGKTTALRLLLNLFPADRGRIRVLGGEPGEAASDRIGYLPEERGLYRRMTVTEVLEYFCQLKGRRPEHEAIKDWLSRLRITEHKSSRIDQLSKGTAQKVQFIAAVLHRPELVILDEPFSGLDPLSSDLLRDAVLLLARNGTTVVVSTHDMSLAEQLCDCFLMLHRGRKVLDATRSDLDASYGEKTIKLSHTGALPDLAGVRQVFDFGAYRELVLDDGCDPQQILRRICETAAVSRFELSRPSLHDIFVRLASE
jgi:ABC-2 type transport system ATP-binding protein